MSSELPSTWGAAPPDASPSSTAGVAPADDNASEWKSEWGEPLPASLGGPSLDAQPAASLKRDGAAAGIPVPAAFKKRLQAATAGGAVVAYETPVPASVPAWNMQGQGGPAPGMMQGMQGQGAPAPGMMQEMQGQGSAGMNPAMMQQMQMMHMMQQQQQGAATANPMGNGMNPMMAQMGMMRMMMMNQMAQAQQMSQMGGAAQAGQMAQMNPMMAQMSQMAPGLAQLQQQMGQTGQMGGGQEAMQALPAHGGPAVDMSSWDAIPDPLNESAEQANAIQEAVAATQHAQYMQQVQFLQQVRDHEAAQNRPTNEGTGGFATANPNSRFIDDYRAFKLCRFFQKNECMQGRRCIYAHCFEELHPASPDMPSEEKAEEEHSVFALAESTQTTKEKDTAPNMRLSKKRDLCRKFQDTGSCSRGSVCPNAHGEAELGKLGFVIYDKVKLKICMAWEKGRCSYSDKCFNAHGDHEIGQKRREFIEGPPMKKRGEGQSLEDYRREILRDPDAPAWPL